MDPKQETQTQEEPQSGGNGSSTAIIVVIVLVLVLAGVFFFVSSNRGDDVTILPIDDAVTEDVTEEEKVMEEVTNGDAPKEDSTGNVDTPQPGL